MLATQGVLKDAGLGKEAIDEVVLVGGSTRIPAIRAALSAFFGGAPLPSRFLAPPSSGPLHCVAEGGRGRPGPQPDNEGFAAGHARVSRSRIGCFCCSSRRLVQDKVVKAVDCMTTHVRDTPGKGTS